MYVIDNAIVVVTVNCTTYKSAYDWLMRIDDQYIPANVPLYFDYYLGDEKYSGYVGTNSDGDVDGLLYFSTLNTTDIITCSFAYPIV